MTTKTLTPCLTLANFEKMYALTEERGRKVEVTKKDLLALLIDHSKAIAMLEDLQVVVEEDYANSPKIRKAR